MQNPLSRFLNVFRAPTSSRTLGFLVVLLLVAAIPLTIFVAQQQQEIRQRAFIDPGTCRAFDPAETACPWYTPGDPCPTGDNTILWKSNGCSAGCNVNNGNADCASSKNDWDSRINPATSNWCFGFNDGPKCITLVKRDCQNRGDPGCPVAPTPTATPPPIACNESQVALAVTPSSLNPAGTATLTINGNASMWITDNYQNGLTCSGDWSWTGGTFATRSCTATRTPGTYAWTHNWKVCSGNDQNCSVECKKTVNYTVVGVPTPTNTPTPTPVTQGSINGTVRKFTDNSLIPGVTVTLVGTTRTTTTSSTGSWAMTNVPAGTRNFTFAKAGFQTLTKSAVIIAGSSISLHVQLVPITGPTATPTPTVPANTARLSFNIKLTSIGIDRADENRDPNRKVRNLEVCLYTKGLLIPANDYLCTKGRKIINTITYNASTGRFINSSFSLPQVASGEYDVYIKTPSYLRKRIPQILNIVLGQTTQVPLVTLILGDIN